MNARLKQPLRINRRPILPSLAAGGLAARHRGLLVGMFGFCCLMPYVAIPVGNHSAIQIGNLLTLVLVLPVLTVSWRNRPFWIYPALIGALSISIFKVA